MNSLDGVALVTGAGEMARHSLLLILRKNAYASIASGIGRELALEYARAGCAAVTLADLDIPGLQQTVDLINKEAPGVKTLTVEVDTTKLDMVRNMVAATVKSFGRLDYGTPSILIMRLIKT